MVTWEALRSEKDDIIDVIINSWPVYCKVCSLFVLIELWWAERECLAEVQ